MESACKSLGKLNLLAGPAHIDSSTEGKAQASGVTVLLLPQDVGEAGCSPGKGRWITFLVALSGRGWVECVEWDCQKGLQRRCFIYLSYEPLKGGSEIVWTPHGGMST